MQRIFWIDGLKGICAQIVVMSHICATFKYAYPSISELRVTPWLGLVINGNFAVYIFILLSTMFMYRRTLDSIIDISKIGSLIRTRYFRLTLPIALVFFIALIMKICGLFFHITLGEKYGFEWLLIDRQEYLSFPFGILLSALGNGCGWFNIMWMMKYIFIGSLFAICLGVGLKEVQTSKRIFYICLFCLLSYFIDVYYCAVCAGCLLHETMGLLTRTSMQKVSKTLCVIVFGITLFIGEHFYSSDIIGIKNLFESFTLIVFINTLPNFQKFLSAPFFIWLGKISYEVFLVHLLIIYSVSSCLYLYFPNFQGKLLIIATSTILLTNFIAKGISMFLSPKMNSIVSKYA